MATSYDGGGDNCLCMPARDWILFAGAILFATHLTTFITLWWNGKVAPDDTDGVAAKCYYAFELCLLMSLVGVLVVAYIGCPKMTVLCFVLVALLLDLALIIINILTLAEKNMETWATFHFVFVCLVIDVICMACMVGGAVMYSGGQ